MKRAKDLKTGEKVYIYSISALQDKEFVDKLCGSIEKTPYSTTAYIYKGTGRPLRYVIRSDEGIVYRNGLWLSEENDELAKESLTEFLLEKINSFKHNIELYESRVKLVNEFFDKKESEKE